MRNDKGKKKVISFLIYNRGSCGILNCVAIKPQHRFYPLVLNI